MKGKVLLVMLLTLTLLWAPTFAWVYPDGSEDALYESYGPRAGKLLIHLYTDAHTQCDALIAGEIDITDWPLSKTVYEELTQWPYNETIQVVITGLKWVCLSWI